MPEGFALDEYVTPRLETVIHVPGGTMPKATGSYGSSFAQARLTVPGPGHYDVKVYDEKYWASKGRSFNKIDRAQKAQSRPGPAVGQYQLAGAMVLTSPRITGGPMTKQPKGCVLYDRAVRGAKGLPDPGSHNAIFPDPHKGTISFNSSKTATRSSSAKPPAPGPGSYELNYMQCERRIPSYSTGKSPTKSHLDDLERYKAKIPAPGYLGIPDTDAKGLDRQGPLKHGQHLLRDLHARG